MSTLYEHPLDSHEPYIDKDQTLTWLVPEAMREEVDSMRNQGYDISFGNTYDDAYARPDSIIDTFTMLHERGEAFRAEMGKFDTGYQAVLSTVRFGAPLEPARNWAKQRLAQRHKKAEALRSSLLYDRLDVQGMPWHDQNGKALALGTIVDAYNLKESAASEGMYETVGGRLTDDILTYSFDDNAGWLSGMDVRTAITESEMRFKKRSRDRAAQVADEEMLKLTEFISAPVRSGFKDIVVNCTDSLGIRSRKEEVRAEINRHVEESNKDSFLMMSVGCGTALPMLEVVADIKNQGKDAKLILLDQDPIALAAAVQFAEQIGLTNALEVHCEQLFHGKGLKTRLLNLQTVLKGRELDVCEDSGLREYFPDKLYRDLTTQAWNALADDGIMTTGNMNKNRPQPEFLHGLMGWPIPVQMRQVADITRLHADAGIPKDASRLRVTQDGVYTLCFSSKTKSV